MVNTYWHDNNLDWDVALNLQSLTLNANPENDSFVLGAEILDDTGWIVGGTWTGSWSTGWYNTSNSNLERPVSITIGSKYLLSFDCWWWWDFYIEYVNIWWASFPEIEFAWVKSYAFTATTTDNLFIRWQTYAWTVAITLKEITQDKLPILLVKDQNWLDTFSIYSSDSTLKNLYMWLGSWGVTTTWANNIGIWNSALSSIISANKNIAIGVGALENADIPDNTGIWYNSMNLLTQWWWNVCIGNNILAQNTYTSNNVWIWWSSLENYTWYWYNTAVWVFAIRWTLWVSTWVNNAAVWAYSLSNNTTWWFNVALWMYSLYSNTTWWFNTAIWDSAWYYYWTTSANANSTYSIFLWASTKASAANGVNEIVIGYNATGNGSNTVTLWHTSITSTYLRWDIRPVDWKNIILGTTTGMKIGTATTQKIGFFNATPIVQVGATIDLWVVLSNLWLRAAGTAYPITTSGLVTLTGGLKTAYVAKTANYTLTTADYLVECTANSFTITLPTAVGITGTNYRIKNSGTWTITVDANGTQTIDGQLTQTLNQRDSLTIVSNGANWLIV